MELKSQQTVQYRLEKNHMYILQEDGKETRFDIVPQKYPSGFSQQSERKEYLGSSLDSKTAALAVNDAQGWKYWASGPIGWRDSHKATV
jgi:hypothetical protein